ncbi:MAG TPA: GTP-binding protein, partial [Chloroflexota bacterium]|nr:GTP-binding protein [Chloroflexota bacterium]
MKTYASDAIRNVGLFSHMGLGKTTLAEAMLFNAGHINRMGRVDEGTTTSDYDPDEHRRTMSVQVSLLPIEWKDHKINVLDTPGYADFVGEVIGAMRVVDGAVILADAVSGLEVGTEQAWEYARERDLPRIVVVNRMDRENANFEGTLQQLRDTFGKCVVPVQVPIGRSQAFAGVVDLLDRKALMFGENGQVTEGEIPADLTDEVQTFADQLMESVAETDDELIMKYLDGKPLNHEEVVKGVHEGVRNGSIVPVVCSAAAANKGVGLILDAITTFLPSPVEVGPTKATEKGKEIELAPDPNGPLAALVFKTLADPFIGKLTYFRVYSGTLKPDGQVWNASKEKEERIGTVMTMRGKTQDNVTAVPAGDIAAVA